MSFFCVNVRFRRTYVLNNFVESRLALSNLTFQRLLIKHLFLNFCMNLEFTMVTIKTAIYPDKKRI